MLYLALIFILSFLNTLNSMQWGYDGKTLYRRFLCWDETNTSSSVPYNSDVASLLTPPGEVSAIESWNIQTFTLDSFHLKQIKTLLLPWVHEGIKEKHIHGMFPCQNAKDEPIFIQFVDRELYVGESAFRSIKYFVDGWIGKHQRRLFAINAIYESILADKDHLIKDFEANICVGDSATSGPEVISFGIAYKEGGGFLPLSEMEIDYVSYDHWEKKYNELLRLQQTMTSWHNKTKKAVFRGRSMYSYPYNANEAGNLNDENIMKSIGKTISTGRMGLIKMIESCHNSTVKDLFDVALGLKNFIPMKEQFNYRYLVYVGGNFGWANRLKLLLASRSAIFYQLNPLGGKEWYADGLLPWVHYIPTDHLLWSLPSMVYWTAVYGDEIAKKVADKAFEYFKFILSPKSMKRRLILLLSEYSTLFRYKIELNPNRTLYSWRNIVSTDWNNPVNQFFNYHGDNKNINQSSRKIHQQFRAEYQFVMKVFGVHKGNKDILSILNHTKFI